MQSCCSSWKGGRTSTSLRTRLPLRPPTRRLSLSSWNEARLSFNYPTAPTFAQALLPLREMWRRNWMSVKLIWKIASGEWIYVKSGKLISFNYCKPWKYNVRKTSIVFPIQSVDHEQVWQTNWRVGSSVASRPMLLGK